MILTVFRHFVTGLGFVLAVASIAVFAQYWDPTRALIKQLTERAPYRYDRIDPRFLQTDPSDLIQVHTAADLDTYRAALGNIIWGEQGMPVDRTADRIDADILSTPHTGKCRTYHLPGHPNPETLLRLICQLYRYSAMANLADIDQLHVTVYRDIPVAPLFPDQGSVGDYIASIAHFRPREGNGRAVIVQYGLAGTYHNLDRHIATLLAEGYGVFALNSFGYGDNLAGGAPQGGSGGLLDVAHPFRGFFEPVTVAVNTALEAGQYRSVDLIGFSTGAWVTSIYAAMDPRIRRSYPVAGTLPMYLRGPKESTQPRFHEPFMQQMSYLDMYVLASAGRDRGQVQVFNRFDRCCFANSVGRLYVDDVKRAVDRLAAGGRFDVFIDESHARHKISQRALDIILADMARTVEP